MKTIKILTVIGVLFLTSFGNEVQAQEKQNDATWEETIEFLNKNLVYFNSSNDNAEISFEIINNKFNLISKSRTTGSILRAELNLDDLENVKRYKNHSDDEILRIRLSSFGKYVKVKKDDGSIEYWQTLPIDSKANGIGQTMFNRVLKALKHLAYLANEKRKESKF